MTDAAADTSKITVNEVPDSTRINASTSLFLGPNKEWASVTFGPGLNVIYGALETGKSFILEALDFMLGAGADLRDIPERVGYDRIFLGVEHGDSKHSRLSAARAEDNFVATLAFTSALPRASSRSF